LSVGVRAPSLEKYTVTKPWRRVDPNEVVALGKKKKKNLNISALGSILRKITVRILGAQTRISDFDENYFTHINEFYCCSMFNNKNGFRFQEIAVGVSRVWESMCNVFAPIFCSFALVNEKQKPI
jgi:hypothetical protein